MTKSIIFSLGESIFGIPIKQVGRLGKPRKLDPLPKAPKWISGLITYRGKILPYIRFWKILKLPAPAKEILLLPYDSDYCAFGISEIKGIFEIEIKDKRSQIIQAPYIIGFGNLEGQVVIVTDLKNFLTTYQKRVVRKLFKKNEKQ